MKYFQTHFFVRFAQIKMRDHICGNLYQPGDSKPFRTQLSKPCFISKNYKTQNVLTNKCIPNKLD
jgi:hypothetical protein